MYDETWSSLKNHRRPEWLDDAKYGIYFHWGPYSVPECGINGSWYPNQMYIKGMKQNRHHVKHYGDPSKFGYKDLIPFFTAEFFDADEWAKLIKDAGAKFAGPVTEHHDGFSMWKSDVNEWNAFNMGPKRDIVGEMATSLRKQGLKFMTAFHHAHRWYFYPHWKKKFDTSDPKYTELYGPLHDENARGIKAWFRQDPPNKEFLDNWFTKIKEVIDNYQPDLMWFDFGLGRINDIYRKKMVAYYYNKAENWGKEVEILYKNHDLPPGVGILDYELGKSSQLTYHKWITDTTVDNQGAWSFVKKAGFKTPKKIIHDLVDRVAKNGYLLMNFGPKANGMIPEETKVIFKELGDWLRVNGEAIYGSTSWSIAEEGPIKLRKSEFIEIQVFLFKERKNSIYSSKDIRFTSKGNALYAIVLGWPKNELRIKKINPRKGLIYKNDIKSITLLGYDGKLSWEYGKKGLTIQVPEIKPCKHAFVFKILFE
ncbi:MAG: alpha-L-fucosidase [Candidatus Lokiarchaeota archaeon]|nr:alpha-L-fucosidase [Candidatus Lokiarchaeota archaeon]